MEDSIKHDLGTFLCQAVFCRDACAQVHLQRLSRGELFRLSTHDVLEHIPQISLGIDHAGLFVDFEFDELRGTCPGCHLALETVQSVCASNGTVFFCGSIQRFTGTV